MWIPRGLEARYPNSESSKLTRSRVRPEAGRCAWRFHGGCARAHDHSLVFVMVFRIRSRAEEELRYLLQYGTIMSAGWRDLAVSPQKLDGPLH